MSTKTETNPKTPTPPHAPGHDCCGGASAAAPAGQASKPTNPAAVGRPAPAAPGKTGCCCGGAKSDPTGPKR